MYDLDNIPVLPVAVLGVGIALTGFTFITTKGSSAADIAQAYPAAAPIAGDIVALSKKLGITDPGWLANLMNFETGGSFSPSIKNKHSGATGLIQFMPSTARGMGTSTSALAQMSQKEQMGWVEKYLMRKKSKGFASPTDVYMAVFYPVAMGQGGNYSIYDHFLRTKGKAAADNYLYQNNGIKTAGDYADFANKRAKLPTGREVGSTGVRVLPWLMLGSTILLSGALYIREAQPSWARALL